jgi:hypothetical protein
MNPKDEAREWLDRRRGREVHVETRFGNGSSAPQVHEGRLTKSEDPAGLRDLYEVAQVSYNLDDLSDDLAVVIGAAEELEMNFDDGTSNLINVKITVIG